MEQDPFRRKYEKSMINKILRRIEAYGFTMMDAPFFGINKDFIKGYESALSDIEKYIKKEFCDE